MTEVLGQDLELSQQVELQFLGQCRYLRGAQFIENDLEHCRSNVNALYAAANPGDNFPCDRAGAIGQFDAGNLLVPVAPH